MGRERMGVVVVVVAVVGDCVEEDGRMHSVGSADRRLRRPVGSLFWAH